MHARTPALPEPPNRPPYLTVKVQEVAYTLRAPSLAKMGGILQRLPDQQRYYFLGLPEVVASGEPIMAVLAGRPDMFALLGAAVGICWADPAWGLDTPPWTEGDPTAYGESVYEELHEAGWSLNQIAQAVLGVATLLVRENALEAAVIEKTAFFRRAKASETESESPSSATPSTVTTESGSTN